LFCSLFFVAFFCFNAPPLVSRAVFHRRQLGRTTQKKTLYMQVRTFLVFAGRQQWYHALCARPASSPPASLRHHVLLVCARSSSCPCFACLLAVPRSPCAPRSFPTPSCAPRTLCVLRPPPPLPLICAFQHASCAIRTMSRRRSILAFSPIPHPPRLPLVGLPSPVSCISRSSKTLPPPRRRPAPQPPIRHPACRRFLRVSSLAHLGIPLLP
jgi:hypothetical protein